MISSTIFAQQQTTMLQTPELRLQHERVNGKVPAPYRLSEKKTRAGSRWYDIVDAIDKDQGGAGNIYSNDNYNITWTDSTMLAPFSGSGGVTYSGVWVKSIAAFFDPVDPRFNDAAAYGGQIHISRNDSYTIDSLSLPYIYRRNPAKTSVVDTLIVSVIKGPGNSTTETELGTRFYGPTTATATNHSTDTLRFLHGFLNLSNGTPNMYTFNASNITNVVNTKILLTAATLSDTLSNGFHYFQIPVGLTIPAGNFAGVSVTFKSGDTWVPFADTLYLSGSTAMNFNNFRFVAFEENTGSYQTYIKGSFNHSGIMRNDTSGWRNWHIPSYAFTNTTYEHHWFSWKVTCTTCGSVKVDELSESIARVDVYPVPASHQLTLSIQADKPLHQMSYQLTTLNGAIVQQGELPDMMAGTQNTKVLDLRTVSSGMYLLRLQSNEGVLNRKVMISKE
jgi:hypothetical protein